MNAFASIADIQALEQQPAPAATTPYGLIRDAAARWPQRVALSWLPDAELSTPPQQLSYRQLLADVWGAEYTEQTHYLRLYMGQLRAKLEDNSAEPQHLLTEPGVGYRLAEGDTDDTPPA